MVRLDSGKEIQDFEILEILRIQSYFEASETNVILEVQQFGMLND